MYIRKWIIGLLAVFVVGCAMVNVYVTFPEEKIKKAAEDILAPSDENNVSSSHLDFFFAKNAYAEEVRIKKAIKTSSPAIEKAKKERAKWHRELMEYEKNGYIGETNSFKVVIKKLPEQESLAKAVRKIIDDENRARESIINEIIEINNVAPNEKETFVEMFSEVSQKYAPEGAWIQKSNGNWIQK